MVNASPTFNFTFKNAPISSMQENFLTLQQVACKLESESKGFKVVLKFRNKRHCLTENCHPAKKQQCVQITHQCQSQQHQLQQQPQSQRSECEFLATVK